MYWDNRRVLVTGGSGFIGGHLAASLRSQGAHVTIFDMRQPRQENFSEYIAADIVDGAAIRSAVKGIDCVFHLAAMVSVQGSIDAPEKNFAINYEATKNLLKASVEAGVGAFLFASSAAIYGDPKYLPVDEKHPLAPMSPYGEAKGHADVLVRKFGAELATSALRLFNVYGPGQSDNSPYSGVIALFRKKTLAGENLMIYGEGSATRDFIHVDDVVLAFTTCAEELLNSGVESRCSGEAFNVCTGELTTILELAELCIEMAGPGSEIERLPAREGDIEHSSGSSGKIQSNLEWEAEVSLEHGLLGIL